MKILYEKPLYSQCSADDDPQKAYCNELRTAKTLHFRQLAQECSRYAQSIDAGIRIEQDDLLQGHIHLWTQRLHFNVRFPGDGANRQPFSALFADADQVVFSVEPENGLLHLHFIFCL